MIVALTGGTGGAKLVEGLAAEVAPAQLTVICNTGDDATFFGLHVSPDIDTITYTLAGLSDGAKGWGIKDDTFAVLEQLRALGHEAWFNLGDKDLATHITRTAMMRGGRTLADITDHVRSVLGVAVRILPMSNNRVETLVSTTAGEISFLEYFVKERWQREVTAVRYLGSDQAEPAAGVLESIAAADGIVICPSNPITSIGPILAVPGVRDALAHAPAPVIGVSPLIGRAAISGPAHKLMATMDLDSSSLGVAQCYHGFLNSFVVDKADQKLLPAIENLGVKVSCSEIRMSSFVEKRRLAREVLDLVGK